MSTAKKLEKIDIRISEEDKNLISEAADFEGLEMSSFVRSTLLKISKEIIQANQTFKLSKSMAESFIKSLENPPEPNEKLKSILARYKG